MFAFPPAIRKMIYTTNALESLHRSLRKIIKTRGSFPSDEAAAKSLFLAIRNAGVRLRRPIDWTAAMGQFATQKLGHTPVKPAHTTTVHLGWPSTYTVSVTFPSRWRTTHRPCGLPSTSGPSATVPLA